MIFNTIDIIKLIAQKEGTVVKYFSFFIVYYLVFTKSLPHHGKYTYFLAYPEHPVSTYCDFNIQIHQSYSKLLLFGENNSMNH